MYSQESVFCECPYCGESIEVLVDPSVSQQEYIEDCSVCCRPMTLRVTITGGGEPVIIARQEDET